MGSTLFPPLIAIGPAPVPGTVALHLRRVFGLRVWALDLETLLARCPLRGCTSAPLSRLMRPI